MAELAAARPAPRLDHLLRVRSHDPYVVKEMHVTIYHVLWELAHVFLERPTRDGARRDDGVRGALPVPLSPDRGGRGRRRGPRAGGGRRGPPLDAGEGGGDRRVARAGAGDLRRRPRRLRRRDGGGVRGGRAVVLVRQRRQQHRRAGGRELFSAPEDPGAGLPAIALTADVAVLTALSNDVSFEVVFARPLAASGRPGDIALGLSTSGGSANVLRGFAEARRQGMLTVGLAGYDGGKMAEADTVDHLFVMPSSSVHRIQEAQTTVYQVLGELTLRALSSPGRPAGGPGSPG